MKHPRHHVTDHALVRYCERVLGMDMAAIRREIGHKVDDAAEDHQGLSAVLIDSHRYVIGEDDKVVTVTHRNEAPRGKGKSKDKGRGLG